MSRFRVLIIDREKVARTRLRRLISLEPGFEVIGECAERQESLKALAVLRPDVVFIDVGMLEQDGFGVMSANTGPALLTILTSADGCQALRGFEAGAFDFLVKRYCRQRVQESLRRVKSRLLPDCTASRQTQRLPDRIAVRNSGSVAFVKIDEVDWIEAADNYVTLHRGKASHIIRATMNEMQARLDPTRFVRVHRSAIVNLDRIQELRTWFRGDYLVILRDGTKLTLTRNHKANLESRLLLGAA